MIAAALGHSLFRIRWYWRWVKNRRRILLSMDDSSSGGGSEPTPPSTCNLGTCPGWVRVKAQA
jgi:hypothetical protein